MVCEGAADERWRASLGCGYIKVSSEGRSLVADFLSFGLYEPQARPALLGAPYMWLELARLFDDARGERAALDRDQAERDKVKSQYAVKVK